MTYTRSAEFLKGITTLHRQITDLECQQVRLEVGNKQAATTFQQFTDMKQRDRRTIEENNYTINQQMREIESLKTEIESLKTEKARLEITVATAWMKVIEADDAMK